MKKILIIIWVFLASFSLLAVKIPYAIQNSTDRIISVASANKTQGPFKCLECGEELILRHGNIKKAHFSHKADPDSHCSGGGPETWEHKLAKQLLADDLKRWTFIENCSDCQKLIKSYSFKSDTQTALLEYHYDRFIADVMVLDQARPVAALEVRHTHAVDEQKLEFFKQQNIPIIEIDAKQVIKSHETGLFKVSLLNKRQCGFCAEKERRQKMRPCLECNKWDLREELSEIKAPLDSKYPTAFVCDDCLAACPSCQKSTTKKQIKQSSYCISCEQRIKSWRKQARQAVNSKNRQELRELLAEPPAEITALDEFNSALNEMEINYRKKQEEQRVLREEQEKQRLIKQEEEKTLREEQEKLRLIKQEEERVLREEQEKLRLIKQEEQRVLQEEQEKLRRIEEEKEEERLRPIREQQRKEEAKQREQERRLEAQKAEEERQKNLIKYKNWLKYNAEEIIKNNRLNLSASFHEKDTVKGLGAYWDDIDKTWFIRAKLDLIEKCAPWLKSTDQQLIQTVKQILLEKDKPKSGKRKDQSQLLKNQGTLSNFLSPLKKY